MAVSFRGLSWFGEFSRLKTVFFCLVGLTGGVEKKNRRVFFCKNCVVFFRFVAFFFERFCF